MLQYTLLKIKATTAFILLEVLYLDCDYEQVTLGINLAHGFLAKYLQADHNSFHFKIQMDLVLFSSSELILKLFAVLDI